MLKKYMMFCAIAVIAFSSCQDRISVPAAGENDQTSVPVGKTLEKTFYSVDGFTRVLLNSTQVLWEKGDEIDILWDGGKASAVADPYNSSLEASFTTHVPEDAQIFFAVHPSSETSSLADGKVKVEVPSVQDGTFSSASIAAARADANDFLVFRHLVSFVEFTIDKCGTLTFSCGSDIAGRVTAAFDNDGALIDYTQSGSGDVISIDIPCSGTYYIALLPDVEMKYISFTLTNGSSIEYIFSSKPRTMTRGKLVGLGNITGRFTSSASMVSGVNDFEIVEYDW